MPADGKPLPPRLERVRQGIALAGLKGGPSVVAEHCRPAGLQEH